MSEDGNAPLANFALLQTPVPVGSASSECCADCYIQDRSRIAHLKNASMLQTPQFDQQASMQAIETLLAATEGNVTEVGRL